MKHILVTGGAGFITSAASNIARAERELDITSAASNIARAERELDITSAASNIAAPLKLQSLIPRFGTRKI